MTRVERVQRVPIVIKGDPTKSERKVRIGIKR